jgi:hypothetical protein
VKTRHSELDVALRLSRTTLSSTLFEQRLYGRKAVQGRDETCQIAVGQSPHFALDNRSLGSTADTVPSIQRKMKTGTDHLQREEKLAALKLCLSAIGHRIEEVVKEKTEQGLNGGKCRKHLWMWVFAGLDGDVDVD